MESRFYNFMELSYNNKKAFVLPLTCECDEQDCCSNDDKRAIIATTLHRITATGYTLSENMIDELINMSITRQDFIDYCFKIINIVEDNVGVRIYKPFYQNFPTEVMEASDAELIINALLHYYSLGAYKPNSSSSKEAVRREMKAYREFMDLVSFKSEVHTYNYELNVIDCMTIGDCMESAFKYMSSPTSISNNNKEFIKACIRYDISCIPDAEMIVHKEIKALIINELVSLDNMEHPVVDSVDTATDILRVITAYSGGDVSLATDTRYVSMPIRMRKWVMRMINDNYKSVASDMKKYRERWLRVGEIIHPMKYQKKYPMAAFAFEKLRNDPNIIITENARVERMYQNDYNGLMAYFETRPGIFARNLHRVLKTYPEHQNNIALRFSRESVVGNISTPVLYQLKSYFENKMDLSSEHIYFVKGEVQKVFFRTDGVVQEDYLSDDTRSRIVNACQNGILIQYAENKKYNEIKNVYIDESLKDYRLPASQRSASRSLNTLTRGSRVKFEKCDVLRAFLHWMNGGDNNEYSIDIDLSVKFLDDTFTEICDLSYFNLRSEYACHSGDYIDAPAPDGASEFIDINIDNATRQGVRYAVLCANSYSGMNYCNVPDCFAGLMHIMNSDSMNEAYIANKVKMKIDLASASQMVTICIIDLVEYYMYWADMATPVEMRLPNNIATHTNEIICVAKSILNMKSDSLYDLARNRSDAEGHIIVDDMANADVIYTVCDKNSIIASNDDKEVIGVFDIDEWMSLL